MLARKSVKQSYQPSQDIVQLMETFRQMVNDCIRIGLGQNCSTLKRLTSFAYGALAKYQGTLTYYKLCAISKAAGILSSQKKSLRRGYPTKDPFVSKPVLVSCYGFRIQNGCLILPVRDHVKEAIALNSHTVSVLSDSSLKVRSFTIAKGCLSLCISKEVRGATVNDVASTVGVDRNLRNVTVGNAAKVTFYDISRIAEITDNTTSIIGSFSRKDRRVGQNISAKYGRRRRERTKRLLHWVSNDIVKRAKSNSQAVIFEDLRDIRKLYRKGNGQGRRFRRTMNSAPFGEIKRQVEYKGAWEGVPVITLTRVQTRGTTLDCPKCGERLQWAVRGDLQHDRQLWCDVCRVWRDRDLVAVLNISRRGWVRFAHSEGGAGEAVKRNPEHEGEPAILRVDASKFGAQAVR